MPRVSLGVVCFLFGRVFQSVRWKWTIGVCLLSLAICGCGSEQTEHVDVIPETTDDASLVYERSTAPINPEALQWSLDKEDQEYLWDLEHHSNLLVQFGLRSVGTAVVEQSVPALVERFSSEFAGEIFSDARNITINDALISSVRRSADHSETRRIEKTELAEFLVSLVQPLGDSARFRFDIKRIFPQDRQRLDELWTALVMLRIWNDRVASAPQEVTLLFRLVFERPSKERFASGGWIHGLKLLQVCLLYTSPSPRD